MSKKQIPSKSNEKESGKLVEATANTTIFEWLERYFEKRKNLFSILITGIAALFAILLFDVKMSTGFDDSMYIESGYNYAKDFFGFWHGANAPLYPMILALPIKLFGINVILLKSLSVIFFVLGIYFNYKAFVGRIPYTILFLSLLIVATNSAFLAHASLTYTEAFFSMIQGLFFLSFFKLTDHIAVNGSGIKENWKQYVGLALVTYFLFMARSVAAGAILAVVVYFLFQTDWKASLFSLLTFIAVALPLEGLKKMIWKGASQVASQGNAMFQKDFYDPGKGQATVADFFSRFWTNAEIYLSSKLWEMLGFRNPDSQYSTGITVFTILLFVTGLLWAIKKKNKAFQAAIIYAGVLTGVTFFALHTNWGQGRLVMIFLPYILFSFFYGIYALMDNKSLSAMQIAFLIIAIIFFARNFSITLSETQKNTPILAENLSGNKYAGYSNDWVNYLKMSEWCEKNLPKESYVACRKNSMSFIYANGKAFYPIFKTTSNNADTLINALKTNKVTHVILAELRMDPSKYVEGSFVNTIHRYLAPIDQKYPGSLKMVHQEGTVEKSQLYEIDYSKIVENPMQPIPAPIK